MQFGNLKIQIGIGIGVAGLDSHGTTIVIVWVILVAVGKPSMLLEASMGVAVDELDVPVVRGGALGFVTGGGGRALGFVTRGVGGGDGLMGDVVFRAGHPEFPASRGAIQTCCRESMPFQTTAG
jgi:hypothetical protein